MSRSFITYLLYQTVGGGATVVLFTRLLYMADYVLGMTGLQKSSWM